MTTCWRSLGDRIDNFSVLQAIIRYPFNLTVLVEIDSQNFTINNLGLHELCTAIARLRDVIEDLVIIHCSH